MCGSVLARISPLARSWACRSFSAQPPAAQPRTAPPALNAALQQCKTAGASACTILLHGDVFYMEQRPASTLRYMEQPIFDENIVQPAGGSQWISISNMNNVFIGGFPGLGSKPLLEFQSIGHFFNLYTVTNFTMEGFDVDMARVPFTHATVTSVGSSTTTFQIVNTSMYPSSPADVSTYPYLSQAQAIIGYDPSSEQFRLPDINSLQNPYPVIFSPDGSTMTLQNIKLDVPIGSNVVIRHQSSRLRLLQRWPIKQRGFGQHHSLRNWRYGLYLRKMHQHRKRFGGLCCSWPCRLQRTASNSIGGGALLFRTLSLRDKEMMV